MIDATKKHRYYKENSESSIIIDLSHSEIPSEEYFSVNKIPKVSQYELYREINRYLYIKIPHTIGCRVPEIYTTDDKHQLLEMEDVGDVSLVDIGYNFTIYKNLIRWLAELYKLTSNDDVSYFIKNRLYDEEAIAEELLDIVMYSQSQNIEYDIENVLEKMDKVPLGICHRNFQSNNIMVCDRKPRIINYQDMCIGPIAFDLASLLYDPRVSISDSDKESLIRLYSLIIGVNFNIVRKWTKICAKIYLMIIGGKYYKKYNINNNQNYKNIADKIIKTMKEL